MSVAVLSASAFTRRATRTRVKHSWYHALRHLTPNIRFPTTTIYLVPSNPHNKTHSRLRNSTLTAVTSTWQSTVCLRITCFGRSIESSQLGLKSRYPRTFLYFAVIYVSRTSLISIVVSTASFCSHRLHDRYTNKVRLISEGRSGRD